MQTSPLQGYQLSLQQMHLWSLYQSNQSYRVQCAFKIIGPLHIEAFQLALQHVINRHEILQTTFYTVQGMDIPVQAITPTRYNLKVIDLSQYEESKQKALFAQLCATIGREQYNVAQGPLLRIAIVRFKEQEHVLLAELPALCADAATLARLITELIQKYTADRRGENSGTEDILQYADVAAWQEALFDEEDANDAISSWRTVDLAPLSTYHVPFEKKLRDEPSRAFRPQFAEIELPRELSTRLAALAGEYGASSEAFLFTCWQIFLWRLTSEPALIHGFTCDGRQYEELNSVMGPCSRTVPIQHELYEEYSFLQAWLNIHQQLEEVKARQYYFLAAFHDQSEKALASFPFSFSFTPWSQPANEEIKLSCLHIYSYTDQFLLKFCSQDINGTIRAGFCYDAARLDGECARIFASTLNACICNAIADPQRLIGSLELLLAEEKSQVLQVSMGPQIQHATLQTFHERFEEQARRHPQRFAVVTPHQQLSYEELNHQANRLAHWLLAHTSGSSPFIALAPERDAFMLIALLAILKAGKAYLPLDPQLPPARLLSQLQQAQPALLLTHASLSSLFAQAPCPVVSLEGVLASLADCPTDNLALSRFPEQLAYLIFTSGSTGTPKGVLVPQQAVSNYLEALSQQIEPQAGWQYLTVSTLAADLGNTAIFTALSTGGCLHVLPSAWLTDGVALQQYLQAHPIDVLKIVPSHLQALLSQAQGVLPRRWLIFGGEACPWSLLAQLQGLPASCRLLNHYGPTEATIGATVYQIPRSRLVAEEEPEGSVPIGSPLGHVQAYVLDAQQQLVPVGVAGELYLGGAGLAQGYLGQREQTAARFVPHPFSAQPGARLYRTGDRVRRAPDGTLQFLGRLDQQIKLRGYRIEPAEIESILKQHPAVLSCVVLLREDQPGNPQLVAYIVPWQKAVLTNAELRHLLQEQLPDYMIPSAFVMLEGLPLTANGKIDRQKLPVPGQNEQKALLTYVPPRNSIEEEMVHIWEDILATRPIGIHDDFFTLGGHSLLATQVISRIRAVFKVNLPIQSIFTTSSIAGISSAVEKSLGARLHDDTPIVRVSKELPLPLSFAQQRLWFLSQLEPESSYYTKAVALELEGVLDEVALERSLHEIIRRHEILRTTFDTLDGQAVQIISAHSSFHLERMDILSIADHEKEERLQNILREFAQHPFDLRHGPVLFMALIRVHSQRHLLAIAMHHIISDAWSNLVFLKELSLLYTAFTKGAPSPLPELPIQYADYALWQRACLQGESLEQELSYWQKQLQGLSALVLPTDHPRASIQTTRGAECSRLLPAALLHDLQALSQQQGATLFMSLLTAFFVLLARYSGQSDLAVGTPVANRGRLELESLIGFFVNTLVLRLDLSDQPTFLQALARLKQVALDAYAHQEVPFEKVVEALEPQRDMSRSPLFQILFVHQSSALPLTALADLSLRLHNIESTTATFDITLMVAESEQGLLSIIEYNTDLFERETIERLLEHWQLLLESIVANPEQPVQYLQLLTPAEQHQLNQWNPSFLPYPSHPCFPTLFAEQVQRAPHAIAIFSEGQTLSYLELHQQSNQLAHYLQRHGIGLEFHVGVCMERTPQLIVTILGILKAGAAYVPVDPNLPEERFFFLLKDAQVPLLLTQQSLRERIPAFPGPCIYLDDEHPIIAQESMDNLDIDLDLANLAYIVYTSGSTGTPKGVLLTHRGLYNLVEVQKHFLGIQASDKVLQFSSISFDSLIWEIVMALGTGASLCIGGTYDVLPGQELLHLLRRQAITIMTVPPSALAVLPAQDLPDLHTILSVGEACPVALANTWSQGRRFIDGYGPTEMTVCATLGDFSVGQEKLTIGKPISHTQVYLLDRFYQPVPVGAVGEIFLSGDGLARGYLHQPDVTAERFIPHPFSHQPGARLYQTGDMGRYRPDGTLEFLGRIDQQVKLRGFRIELAEIETALLQHPAIHQSIVLMHEHADRGKYLVAYLVAKDKELSQETIRHYLQRRLPVYMIPASFVFLDTLPLNQSGKIDRQSLQHLHATQTQEQSAVAAPRNEVEELLVDLWSEVLGLPQIGIHDNFFSSGGHSLLASQLIARIRATMRIDVPLMHLFTSPTISEFAAVLPQYETTSGQIAAIARTRKRLKGLTPEEMQALLDEKKRGNRG